MENSVINTHPHLTFVHP